MSESGFAEENAQMAHVEFPYALPQATRMAIISGYYVDANHGGQTRAVVFGSELDFRFVADSRRIEICPRMSLATIADMPFAEHPVPVRERIEPSPLNRYMHLAIENGITPFRMINVQDNLGLARTKAANTYAEFFNLFNLQHLFDATTQMGSALNDFYASLPGRSSRANTAVEIMQLEIQELPEVPKDSWLATFWDLSARLGVQPVARRVRAREVPLPGLRYSEGDDVAVI